MGVQFLQLLRKDRSTKQKAKDDKRHKGQKNSNAPKRSQREGRKVKGGPTTTIVGASADKTTTTTTTTTQKPQKHQREHQPLPTPAPNGSTATSDPNLSLRLSTTQEDLLKDLSVYVKDHDVAPAENAAASSSPSADTAATVPESPWTNAPVVTPVDSGSGSTPGDGGDDNSVCSGDAVLHAGIGHRISDSAKTMDTVVSQLDDQPQPQVARPRSLQKEFDSVSDANIFGGLDDVQGETDSERRNSAAGDTTNTTDAAAAVGGAGGFSLLGEIDGIREKAKKAIRASNNKIKMADLIVSKDVSGSSFDDSYSFNDSYDDDRVTLYDEIVDFLCCDLTVPASSGTRDGRDRSSVTTGRTSRRSDSHSRRHGRRRSKSGRGRKRGGASKDRSNRNRK